MRSPRNMRDKLDLSDRRREHRPGSAGMVAGGNEQRVFGDLGLGQTRVTFPREIAQDGLPKKLRVLSVAAQHASWFMIRSIEPFHADGLRPTWCARNTPGHEVEGCTELNRDGHA